jgi:hypothetical protein
MIEPALTATWSAQNHHHQRCQMDPRQVGTRASNSYAISTLPSSGTKVGMEVLCPLSGYPHSSCTPGLKKRINLTIPSRGLSQAVFDSGLWTRLIEEEQVAWLGSQVIRSKASTWSELYMQVRSPVADVWVSWCLLHLCLPVSKSSLTF